MQQQITPRCWLRLWLGRGRVHYGLFGSINGAEIIGADAVDGLEVCGVVAFRRLDTTMPQELLGFNEAYQQPDGKITLLQRRPTMLAVVELRPENGFYSVVTSFPKDNPSWRPEGVRILDGRRAAFTRSERAPGHTAQGSPSPNPPREPLPGKYSWDYLRRISVPVKGR